MSIVMGLDQHRAQITAEWIDLRSGEISRARVRPADRSGVRRFLSRFAGEQLEVALEATTGWRFLVEELRAVGAGVHLAEPAETAALRGNKKRELTVTPCVRAIALLEDRPDPLLPLRVLLNQRVPQAHLRAQIEDVIRRDPRLRQSPRHQYHHGCPRRPRGLMVGDGREWLDAQPLPETARQQVRCRSR
jgi:transposase